MDDRTDHLEWLRHWYERTENPLYVWEAVALCLRNDDPPSIPDWCLPYFRDAAFRIFQLTRRKDFRRAQSKAGTLSDEEAMALIAQALLLSRQGKRNSFADLAVDRDDARDARSVELWGHGALAQIAKRRGITEERAKRRVSRGGKLLRRPR